MGAHAPDIDGGGGCDVRGLFWDCLPGILGALAALVIEVPLLYYSYRWFSDEGKYAEYSVAVAAFSGLDPDRDLAAPVPLDPTFDLTVRIKEPRKWSTACVPRTTAAVSYRGAWLAGVPVPGFARSSEAALRSDREAAGEEGAQVRRAAEAAGSQLGTGDTAILFRKS